MDDAGDDAVRLPPAVQAYLEECGVDLSVYENAHTLPRFVRVRPGRDVDAVAAELSAELGVTVSRVAYQPSFLQLPASVAGVAHTAAARRGDCTGMDVSSGVCVAALQVEPHHHVLDLCAAPGAKLAMLADLLDRRGSVTAADVSRTRMATCRTLLGQLGLIRQPVPRVRLVVADGRAFPWEAPVGPPWDAAHPQRPVPEAAAHFAHCHRDLATLPARTGHLYDRVLVDAPCTHDGSIRHMIKAFGGGSRHSPDAAATFLQGMNPAALRALQIDLLVRGFDLLRPGGRLVYSTCSFTRAQNEDVVLHVLNVLRPDQAFMLPLPEGVAPAEAVPSAELPLAIRMHPQHTHTSALFIACIGKRNVE